MIGWFGGARRLPSDRRRAQKNRPIETGINAERIPAAIDTEIPIPVAAAV
jgi:hypothetical protein